jgi:fucose permease
MTTGIGVVCSSGTALPYSIRRMNEPKPSRAIARAAWTRAATPLLLFVMLGLPAGAIGVAWPHMRASLNAPLAGLGLLLAAFTAGYFLASVTSGPLGARLGTPALLIGGCGLSCAGLLGLAVATQWWVLPVGSLLAGGGSGLIDAAVNAHVSVNRGVRYMGWLHASWAVGAAIGPQVVVLSLATTQSWRAAFAVVGIAFLAIGLLVTGTRQDWTPAASNPTSRAPAGLPARGNHRRTMLILAGLFLLAAGLEATAGDWSYTQLTIGRSLAAGPASWAASLFWVGLATGRIALGLFGDRTTPTRLLDASVGAAGLAALTYWLAPPVVAAYLALPVLGVAVSALFPLMLSVTPARVGAAATAHAVGYQLAGGTLGAGGLPALTGLVLQAAGVLALGPLLTVMAACMLVLHLVSRDSFSS